MTVKNANIPFDHYVPHSVCPHCLESLEFVLPVEPLYDMAVAAAIIPMSYITLSSYLSALKIPKRYRRARTTRLHRMLTAKEIRAVRGNYLIFKDADGIRRLPDEHGN